MTSIELHTNPDAGVITESTPPAMPGERRDFLWLLSAAVAGLISVAAGLRIRQSDEAEPHTLPGSWRTRTLMSAGLMTIGLGMSSLISITKAENLSRTSDYGNPAQWWNSAHLLLAGTAEEPFFSALPIVLLFGFFARVRPWMIGIVITNSALFRASIHLYQGTWQALHALVWGSVAIYLYYRLRSLTGLIIAHTSWNALVIAGNGYYTSAQVMIGGCITVAALWATYRLSTMCPTSSDQALQLQALDAGPLPTISSTEGHR